MNSQKLRIQHIQIFSRLSLFERLTRAFSYNQFFAKFMSASKKQKNWHRIFSRLNQRKLDYILVGGAALAAHGIPRSTLDIDICVPVNKDIASIKKVSNRAIDLADLRLIKESKCK